MTVIDKRCRQSLFQLYNLLFFHICSFSIFFCTISLILAFYQNNHNQNFKTGNLRYRRRFPVSFLHIIPPIISTKNSCILPCSDVKTSFRSAFHRNDPLSIKDDLISHVPRKIHFMCHDHHSHMLCRQILNYLQNLPRQLRIQRRSRFIKKTASSVSSPRARAIDTRCCCPPES